MRPTIAHILQEHIAHWPPDYSACLKQSRDVQGRFHWPTLEIPPSSLNRFNYHFRKRLQEIPSFQDSFYLHEWRGTKGRSVHNPEDDDEEVDAAFDAVLDALDTDEVTDTQEWYVDVGLEVALHGHIVQWLSKRHKKVLQYAFPERTDEELVAVLRSTNFHRDISASLYQLAGFRVETKAIGRQDDIVYLNVYTTDKSPTYQLHYGAFRRHKAADTLPQKIDSLIKDVQSLGSVWDACAGSNSTGIIQEGAARLEARVLMHPGRASATFRNLSREFINTTMVAIDAYEWW